MKNYIFTKLRCPKCKYVWETTSEMFFVTCPKCRNKIKIEENKIKKRKQKIEKKEENKIGDIDGATVS